MREDVLLPHDLTELSDAALVAVRALGARPGQLHVLHVLPRIEVRTPVLVWPRDEDQARVAHARQVLQRRLQGTGYDHAVLHVQIGDPASRIVELARELGVKQIVMPSHSRSGLARLLLGSVTEHVVRFAPCPVLVLPAAVTAPRAALPAEPPLVDQSPTEQVEGLACQILREVAQRDGHLTAVRIAVPPGREPSWWEEALQERLATSGIEFVDLVVAPASTAQAQILDLRFD
jgi:nucleotide-binding universal stress UspA family protein